jgi:hypothetical protein
MASCKSAVAAISISPHTMPIISVFPFVRDLDGTPLANALTSGGAGGIFVRSSTITGGVSGASLGTYTVTPGGNYGLTRSGIVLSTGNVADYQTGPNTSGQFTTEHHTTASPAVNKLLTPITKRNGHSDPAALDVVFDVGITTKRIEFDVVFGSEEYSEWVASQYLDGFGLYLNGKNIAYVGGKPVNIDHPAMAAIAATELDGVLAPFGNPVVRFSAPVTPGSKNNKLQFAIGDSSDARYDTTAYISALGGTTDITFHTLRNFDVVSPSNMQVNDFQITLKGVSRPFETGTPETPDYVGGQLTGIYPPSHKYGQLPPGWTPESVTTNGSDTVVKWGPGSFITGQKLHFGVQLAPDGESACYGICMAWTQNGVPVYEGANPNLPITVHTPHPRPGEASVQIVNQTCPEQAGPPANRWLGAIQALVLPNHLDISDLVIDNEMMLNAPIIREEPTYLAAGEILTLSSLDAASPIEDGKSIVVWYHVFEDQSGFQGSYIGTSFTAFNFETDPERPVPEPASVTLICAAVVLGIIPYLPQMRRPERQRVCVSGKECVSRHYNMVVETRGS